MTHAVITLSRQLDDYPEPIRLRLITAWRLVPFSTSTFWRKNRRGKFPAPVKVSKSITAWRVGQMRQWLIDPARFQQARQKPLLPRSRHDR
jgi:predicted DNA-binding transcriptional regulator AlpA